MESESSELKNLSKDELDSLSVGEKREWLANAFKKRLTTKDQESLRELRLQIEIEEKQKWLHNAFTTSSIPKGKSDRSTARDLPKKRHKWIEDEIERKKFIEHELGLHYDQETKDAAVLEFQKILNSEIVDQRNEEAVPSKSVINSFRQQEETSIDITKNSAVGVETTTVFYAGDVTEISFEQSESQLDEINSCIIADQEDKATIELDSISQGECPVPVDGFHIRSKGRSDSMDNAADKYTTHPELVETEDKTRVGTSLLLSPPAATDVMPIVDLDRVEMEEDAEETKDIGRIWSYDTMLESIDAVESESEDDLSDVADAVLAQKGEQGRESMSNASEATSFPEISVEHEKYSVVSVKDASLERQYHEELNTPSMAFDDAISSNHEINPPSCEISTETDNNDDNSKEIYKPTSTDSNDIQRADFAHISMHAINVKAEQKTDFTEFDSEYVVSPLKQPRDVALDEVISADDFAPSCEQNCDANVANKTLDDTYSTPFVDDEFVVVEESLPKSSDVIGDSNEESRKDLTDVNETTQADSDVKSGYSECISDSVVLQPEFQAESCVETKEEESELSVESDGKTTEDGLPNVNGSIPTSEELLESHTKMDGKIMVDELSNDNTVLQSTNSNEGSEQNDALSAHNVPVQNLMNNSESSHSKVKNSSCETSASEPLEMESIVDVHALSQSIAAQASVCLEVLRSFEYQGVVDEKPLTSVPADTCQMDRNEIVLPNHETVQEANETNLIDSILVIAEGNTRHDGEKRPLPSQCQSLVYVSNGDSERPIQNILDDGGTPSGENVTKEILYSTDDIEETTEGVLGMKSEMESGEPILVPSAENARSVTSSNGLDEVNVVQAKDEQSILTTSAASIESLDIKEFNEAQYEQADISGDSKVSNKNSVKHNDAIMRNLEESGGKKNHLNEEEMGTSVMDHSGFRSQSSEADNLVYVTDLRVEKEFPREVANNKEPDDIGTIKVDHNSHHPQNNETSIAAPGEDGPAVHEEKEKSHDLETQKEEKVTAFDEVADKLAAVKEIEKPLNIVIGKEVENMAIIGAEDIPTLSESLEKIANPPTATECTECLVQKCSSKDLQQTDDVLDIVKPNTEQDAKSTGITKGKKSSAKASSGFVFRVKISEASISEGSQSPAKFNLSKQRARGSGTSQEDKANSVNEESDAAFHVTGDSSNKEKTVEGHDEQSQNKNQDQCETEEHGQLQLQSTQSIIEGFKEDLASKTEADEESVDNFKLIELQSTQSIIEGFKDELASKSEQEKESVENYKLIQLQSTQSIIDGFKDDLASPSLDSSSDEQVDLPQKDEAIRKPHNHSIEKELDATVGVHCLESCCIM
jgi:hypothetical protein